MLYRLVEYIYLDGEIFDNTIFDTATIQICTEWIAMASESANDKIGKLCEENGIKTNLDTCFIRYEIYPLLNN